MEKLCRGLCKENKEITFEESLENWQLPPFPASNIYKRSGLFNSSPIKTVEKEIPLSEGYSTFPLFSDNLKSAYKKCYGLHFGMIQVGLKPKKLGSNTSAVICVRDKRRPTFDESVLAMAESSLCDGPIYFSYFPPQSNIITSQRTSNIKSVYVALSDDLSSSFSIDIKTRGCTGDDGMILLYRLHYRMNGSNERTRGLSRYCVDKFGITTVFVTDSNHTWPKKISWYDDVALPERWVGWKETAEEHLLQLSFADGWKKEEIDVTVEACGIIMVRGERIENSDDKRRLMKHLDDHNFIRRWRLPENAKAEEVRAVMENGVMVVVVPKKDIDEELREKVVDIVGCS